MIQLSQYITAGKTIALTIQTFVGKVMSLFFNMLSRFVVAFLLRNKRLLISWLQSPFAVTILTECGPLEKGMANHFSILALRTP